MGIHFPATHEYGYGQDRSAPVALVVEMRLDGVNLYNVAQYELVRSSFDLNVDSTTGAVQCTFDLTTKEGVFHNGTTYVVQDEIETHVYDALSSPYVRYADLLTTGVSSTTMGSEKIYHVRLSGKGQVVMAKPPKQLVAPWPVGDGTPFVDTLCDAVSSTGSQVFHVVNPTNIKPGNTYYAYNANYSNFEVITITGYSGGDPVAVFKMTKSAAWHLVGSISSRQLLGDGWWMQDSVFRTTAAIASAGTGSRTVYLPNMADVYPNGSTYMYVADDIAGSRDEIVQVTNTGATFSISTWTFGGAVVTVNLTAPHGITVGTTGITANISGSTGGTGSGINGTHTNVTAQSATALQIPINPGGPSGSGGSAQLPNFFTAPFGLLKNANFVVKPFIWQYSFFDEFYNNSGPTLHLSLGVTAGSNRVFTPVENSTFDLRYIFVGRVLWIADSSTGNRERLTVTAVGGGTFTATCVSNYASLSTLIYAGYPVDVAGIEVVQVALPHMQWPTGTEHMSVIDDLRSQNLGNAAVNTTSGGSITANTYSTVTIPGGDSTAYMSPGMPLRVYNDDFGGMEIIYVSEILNDDQFKAFFTLAKATVSGQPWHIIGGQAGDFRVTFPVDTGANAKPWVMAPYYTDAFDPLKRCAIKLKDLTVLSPTTEARYSVPYSRDIDGLDRITRAYVAGSNGALGQYIDLVAESLPPTGIGRQISRFYTDTTLVTNAACDALALQKVKSFNRYRESIRQVETLALLDPDVFRKPLLISWQHRLESGTPAWYPVQHINMGFPEGPVKYRMDLGDSVPGIGDASLGGLGFGRQSAITMLRPPTNLHLSFTQINNGWIITGTMAAPVGMSGSYSYNVHIQRPPFASIITGVAGSPPSTTFSFTVTNNSAGNLYVTTLQNGQESAHSDTVYWTASDVPIPPLRSWQEEGNGLFSALDEINPTIPAYHTISGDVTVDTADLVLGLQTVQLSATVGVDAVLTGPPLACYDPTATIDLSSVYRLWGLIAYKAGAVTLSPLQTLSLEFVYFDDTNAEIDTVAVASTPIQISAQNDALKAYDIIPSDGAKYYKPQVRLSTTTVPITLWVSGGASACDPMERTKMPLTDAGGHVILDAGGFTVWSYEPA